MASQVKSLTGKVALCKHNNISSIVRHRSYKSVTGSSKGIGAAILTRLASHGADVVVNYHSSPEAAEAIVREGCSFGVRAICVQADVSKSEPIAHLFKAAIDEFGAIDIAMSNSGIEHFDEISNVKGEDVNKVFDIDVRGHSWWSSELSRMLVIMTESS